MDQVDKYYKKIIAWIEKNPGKATLVGIFFIGLIIGGLIF